MKMEMKVVVEVEEYKVVPCLFDLVHLVHLVHRVDLVH